MKRFAIDQSDQKFENKNHPIFVNVAKNCCQIIQAQNDSCIKLLLKSKISFTDHALKLLIYILNI